MDSAIGLSTMVAVGPDNFKSMLDGFHEMDERICKMESATGAELTIQELDGYAIKGRIRVAEAQPPRTAEPVEPAPPPTICLIPRAKSISPTLISVFWTLCTATSFPVFLDGNDGGSDRTPLREGKIA